MVNLAISSHKLWTAIIGDSESNEEQGSHMLTANFIKVAFETGSHTKSYCH